MNSPGQSQSAPNKGAPKAPKKRSQARQALGYAFAPNLGQSVRPIVNNLSFFRRTLASLFLVSGMLSPTHPFFREGVQFTIADLFRETYARFDWKDTQKLPQNIFFLAVWGLLGLSLLWVVAMVFWLLLGAGVARAEDTPADGGALFSILPDDLATHFINNLIEGTPIPASGEVGAADYRRPGPVGNMIQEALRGMLEFYSSAILAFASFLLLYHIINMVVQAAWSGKALEGSAQIWAPLRLVLAIGLLVPFAGGLNAAQLMTLEIAKMGSSLATRAWQTFSTVLTSDDAVTRVGITSLRGVEDTAQRLMVIYGCMADVNIQIGKTQDSVSAEDDAGDSETPEPDNSLGGILSGLASAIWNAPGAVAGYFFDNTIIEKVNWDHPQNERLISVGSSRNPNLCGLTSLPAQVPDGASKPVDVMRATIQNGIAEQSETLRGAVKVSAACMAAYFRAIAGDADEAIFTALCGTPVPGVSYADIVNNNAAGQAKRAQLRNKLMSNVTEAVRAYYTALAGEGGVIPTAAENIGDMNDMSNSSWVEAGAYFMRVSAIQSAILSASSASMKASFGNMMGTVQDIPQLAAGTRRAEAEAAGPGNETGGNPFFMSSEQTEYFNTMLKQHADFVYDRSFQTLLSTTNRPAGEATVDATGAVAPGGPIEFLRDGLFGADKEALITMMTKDGTENPLGALFKFGHDLYVFAQGLFLGGIGASLLSMIPVINGIASAAANVSFLLGFILLNVSFPLVFLLPIMPLVRFLAGVMSWLLGVFEAVVSMPLFALAHLNPKGNTLFEPAQRGYHYLLHIALKPILLVFGMIGAIIILPIVLYALNIMYGTALDTMWGNNVGLVDKVMFFMAYATTAYAFVNITFRAIDDLSKNSLNWGNFQGYSFRDDSETVSNQGAAFAQYATSWGQQAGQALGGLKKGIGSDIDKFNKSRNANMQLAREAHSKGFIDNKGKMTEAGMQQFGAKPKLDNSGNISGSTGGDQAALKSFQSRTRQGMGALRDTAGKRFGLQGGGTQTRSEMGYNEFKGTQDEAKKVAKEEAATREQGERDLGMWASGGMKGAPSQAQASAMLDVYNGMDETKLRSLVDKARDHQKTMTPGSTEHTATEARINEIEKRVTDLGNAASGTAPHPGKADSIGGITSK